MLTSTHPSAVMEATTTAQSDFARLYPQEVTLDPRYPTKTEQDLLDYIDAWGSVEEGEKDFRKRIQERQQYITMAKVDPLRFGYRPPIYEKVDAELKKRKLVSIFGINRGGKSNYCYWHGVNHLKKNPGHRVAFFEMSEDSSINKQQERIYRMLPPEWRNLGRKGKEANIKWEKLTGFANARFACPNGSVGYFFFYKQDISLLEGYEFDLAVFEENLPFPYLDTMGYRNKSADRRIQILYNVTPKYGFTPALKAIMQGMEVRETARAKLLEPNIVHVDGCPPGHMPVLMSNEQKNWSCVFFHPDTNPMGAGDVIVEEVRHKSTDEIKCRAYGWVSAVGGKAFPKFNKNHLVTREKFNEIASKGGTYYLSCDPGDRKHWSLAGYLHTPQDDIIKCWEWPDYKHYGEWALPTEGTDWKPGPAQANTVSGFVGYKEIILKWRGATWDEVKGIWETLNAKEILRMLMDSRGGSSAVIGQDDNTTIIEEMNTEQLDAKGRVIGPAMYWEKAAGTRVSGGEDMINTWLDYDTTKPISHFNKPRFYIVDDLANTILAYQEWTSRNSSKCSLKDILDPDFYLAKSDPIFIDGTKIHTEHRGHL